MRFSKKPSSLRSRTGSTEVPEKKLTHKQQDPNLKLQSLDAKFLRIQEHGSKTIVDRLPHFFGFMREHANNNIPFEMWFGENEYQIWLLNAELEKVSHPKIVEDELRELYAKIKSNKAQ